MKKVKEHTRREENKKEGLKNHLESVDCSTLTPDLQLRGYAHFATNSTQFTNYDIFV